MVEDIRNYVITIIIVKRYYTRKWRYDCGSNILAKVEKERKKVSNDRLNGMGVLSMRCFRITWCCI